jgi:O-antigen/teichoic acid export membrane protein
MNFLISKLTSLLKHLKNTSSTNVMILFLSFSNIIGNTLNIAAGLFTAKWLLPEQLGLFNGFSVITSYIILAQLGIPSGLGRELSFYIGKGDTAKAKDYAAVAQYWGLMLGIIAFAGSAVIALYFLIMGMYEYAAGTLVIGITAFQTFYVTKYLDVLYRTNKDFNSLSKIKLIVSFVTFASIILVWKFGFYGLCIRAGVLAAVDFYFTWRWKPFHVRPFWKKELFGDLSKVGLPMYMISRLYGLWPSLQRSLILLLGGTKFLGLFALAIIVESAMKALTSSISSVVYPTMVTQWGKGASIGELTAVIRKPVLIATGIFLLAVPVGWYLLPIVVKAILPNYTTGIPAAQWMLVVGLVEVSVVFANIYNVIRRQGDRLLYFLSGVLSWALTVFVLYQWKGFSMPIFPQSMIVAFAVMFGINLYHLRKYRQLKLAA